MLNNNLIFAKGALGYQDYKNIIKKNIIFSSNLIPENSIQPASIDLRLGKKAYKIEASFLSPNQPVMDRIKKFLIKEINISEKYLFKKNTTYLVEIDEELNLNESFFGKCNPKSSTGRLDIFCRTITDYNSEYEKIPKGYKGKIFLEITSKTFDIVLCQGDKLNQLRLRNINTEYIDDKHLIETNYNDPFLFDENHNVIKPVVSNGLKITANISPKNSVIAYRAIKNAPEIIFSKLNFYNIKDFWTQINETKLDSIIIEPNEFYLLKSKEKIRIIPTLAAEMVPYDTDIGEFRVHYAGFFDPGFGNENKGSFAVLEIKTYEIPFAIEDGQSIARLIFEKLANTPDKLYGEDVRSNYQNQGLALSKHFKVLK